MKTNKTMGFNKSCYRTISTIAFCLLTVFILSDAAWAMTIFVDGQNGNDASDGLSWATAKKSISAGINAAVADDEIWIRTGVYRLTSEILVNKAVAIYGGFIGTESLRDHRNWMQNITTVDGQKIIRCFNISASATLDGFQVINGNSLSEGAAIYINSSITPTIRNCLFLGNTASTFGGAIYGFNIISGAIENCRFEQNNASAGGAIYLASSSLSIDRCLFHYNTAQSGGALYINQTSAPSILSSIFSGNVATGTDPDNGGGAVKTDFYSYPTFVNCTFYGNSAAWDGGAFIFSGTGTSPPVGLNNSIVWGNTADTYGHQIRMINGVDLAVNYSDVQGGQLGIYQEGNVTLIYDDASNIDSDPQFYDPSQDDFHLTAGSPCVNAGSNSPLIFPLYDFENEPRIVNATVDIGADEYQDTDSDGMPDWWEQKYSVDLPNDDADGDGLTNFQEYQYLTFPNNPDSDGDGVNDWQEVFNGTDPRNPASFTQNGTGVVSGTVKDASGNTIVGGNFTLALVSGAPCGNFTFLMWVGISPNGDFAFTNVPPGNYYVGSNNQNQSNYVNEWWNGTDGSYICSTAVPVTVVANSVSSGINFRLETGGSIAGSVTNGSVGIPNVCLNVMSDPCSGSWMAGSQTDGNGNYTVRGVPAGSRYLVTYTGCATDPQYSYYIDEWWNGQKLNTDCNSVPGLTVQAGAQQTVNFTLELGGSISGKVITDTGQSLQNVCVSAFADRCWQNVTGGTQTDINGNYTISALPVGDYFVVTSASCGQQETNIKDEWYNDFKLSEDCNRATPVAVTGGANIQNINFELSNSFSISGSVMHILENGTHSTYLEVSIGNDFVGSVPADITSVSATSPGGTTYPLTLNAQFNVWGRTIADLPEIGTWKFTATSSGGATGTDTDYQYIIRDIPPPDTAFFKSDLTTSTPSFSWAPVEYVPPAGFHKIPLYYRLVINQDNGGSPGNRVFDSGRALNMLYYTVPDGKLAPGNYLWRVRVYDSADWKTAQNRANSQWVPITISAASTGNHGRKPAIDPEQWGTVTWNQNQRLWSVNVIDHDGVAGDGSSHTVTVTGPDGTFGPFGFIRSITPYSAYYELWDGGAAPGTGTYTFTVTDPKGNQGTFVENFTNPNPPVAWPDVTTFNQSVRSESVSAVFDNVFVNGQPYDDFNSYSSINDIDYSRWQWYESASIVNQQLLLATGGTVGRASASLDFAKPESITSIRADIKLTGSTSENARAEIAGGWGNNGQGDIWTVIRVLGNRVVCSVAQNYLDENANYKWDTIFSEDILLGNFLNQTVTTEIAASLNPATKTMTITFTANGTSKICQVPNIVGPQVFDLGKQLRTRINLVTDPVSEFTLDSVLSAERYRLGIYRWDNNSRLGTVMGYSDPATSKVKFLIPPGLLNPGSYFRYRIEAWDAPDPLNVNGVSKMPIDSNDNYRFYTSDQEPQAPYIDFNSQGVCVLNDSIRGPHLSFVAEVHDAQGVPGNIASVKVRHPSGEETSLDYQMNWQWGTKGPTNGYYWARSLSPIEQGPYTFTVRDLQGNEYSRVEELSPLATPLGFPAASSLVATPSANNGTAVDFDWDDVPGIGPSQGFYRLEIFDYDYNVVAKFATTQSQFSLPPGVLKEGFYRWRVITRWEYWSDNADNGSNSPANQSSMPTFVTPPASDSDQDGLPDSWEDANGLNRNLNDAALDPDRDGLTNLDEYLRGTNPGNADTDGDGVSDGTEVLLGTNPLDVTSFPPPSDVDGDGIPDASDNCVDVSNPTQSDLDGNGWGDACDDMDGDGQKDDVDPWPFDPQNDVDGDGIPADPLGLCKNVCPTCTTLKTLCQSVDNCPTVANPGQQDSDGDGLGDACDSEISASLEPPASTKPPKTTVQVDTDGDGIADTGDNCPNVANPGQEDMDHDGIGDACDPDIDGDGVLNPADNCPRVANPGQENMDGDGFGDACDDDIDGDDLLNSYEIQIGTSPTKMDTDGDGLADNVDLYPLIAGAPPAYSIEISLIKGGANVNSTWLPTLTWDTANRKWAPEQLTLTAALKRQDGTSINYSSNVTFQITSTTNFEGVAVNDIEQFTMAPANDFSFSATDRNLLTQTVSNPGTNSVSRELYAFDFGGRVSVKVSTLVAGSAVEAVVKLPLDSDNDGLPDAWELAPEQAAAGFKAFNANSFSPDKIDGDADIDTSLNNSFAGDGLTNFKEYRGVVFDEVKNANGTIIKAPEHKRLNPKKKDLFVRGDNFSNSLIKSYTAQAGAVLPFSVDYAGIYAVQGGLSAFEETGLTVHDVTGMASFVRLTDPLWEPPNIDIVVVTNKTEPNATGFIELLGLGSVDGYINHPYPSVPRYWTWDTKGASGIGDSQFYAVTAARKTETYHLSMMHYVFNRPYLNEVQPTNSPCYSALYNDKLDPLSNIEDRYLENGIDPPDRVSGKVEDSCIKNTKLNGDRMVPTWSNGSTLWGSKKYEAGINFSVFDADGDGRVENPIADMGEKVQYLNFGTLDRNDALQLREYSLEQVQLHTVLHEMGHAVGADKNHTSDPACLMYSSSPDWNRAHHFSDFARGQIMIHNKTE